LGGAVRSGDGAAVTTALAPPDTTLEILPLSPAIGVEVRGLDLTASLEAPVFEKIKRAWEENCILLFRDQHLSAVQQFRIARRFGPLGKNSQGHDAMFEVANGADRRGYLPNGPIAFHSDQADLEAPAMATLLYAIQVTSHGGNTCFANGLRAYDTLPEPVKTRLAGCRALNAYDYFKTAAQRPEILADSAVRAAHPIFRLHPPTGRKAIFVNRLMTWSILAMAAEESQEMLQFLFDHQQRPEFVYEHAWRPGDLMVWDNRSCIHARTDFDAAESRRMRRITVLGDKPYE
jgi:taurine dioxygenase